MSCKRSDEFIGQAGSKIDEQVDAKKVRFGPDDLVEVFGSASRVVVAKGKRVLEFNLNGAPPEADLVKAAIGPSGNLRAPTARVGATFVIGFNEEMWAAVLG